MHCPLFIRSQWHRHRTWSYNEISRRYTDVDIEFYTPPELREQAESDRQASRPAEHLDQAACKALIEEHHKRSLDLYHKLLEQGVCREQARGVLPQDMMTTFWATVDLNNLLKFLELRDSDHAQWEIREYELLTQYGPIGAVCFQEIEGVLGHADGEAFDCADLYRYVRHLQPQTLVAFEQGIHGSEDFFSCVKAIPSEDAPDELQGFIHKQADKTLEIRMSLTPNAWGYQLADRFKQVHCRRWQ